MCCSGKCASISDSSDVVQLRIRIVDDQHNDDEESNESKLLNRLKSKLTKAYLNCEITNEAYQQECDEIISHGIFSDVVISKLLKYGLSKDNIIKMMKSGLESCKFKHLNYDCIFDNNEELIEKLINMGFSEEESLDFIMNGLADQDECYLFRLTLHDIFATKIVKWQGPMTKASNIAIEFLKQLGFDNGTMEIVAEKGISAEAKEIMKDLGFTEFNQQCFSQIVEEPTCICVMGKKPLPKSIQNSEKSYKHSTSSSNKSEESYEERNVISRDLAASLTWAMSETLKYNPTDPVHYVACQLLRWKHNNIEPSKVKEIIDFVNKA